MARGKEGDGNLRGGQTTLRDNTEEIRYLANITERIIFCWFEEDMGEFLTINKYLRDFFFEQIRTVGILMSCVTL